MDTQSQLGERVKRVYRLRSETYLVLLSILHPNNLDRWHPRLPGLVHSQGRNKDNYVTDRFDGGASQSSHFPLSRHFLQVQGLSGIYAADHLVFNLSCPPRHQHNHCLWWSRHGDAAVVNLHRNGLLLCRLNVHECKLAVKRHLQSCLLLQHLYIFDPESCYLRRWD